MAAMLWFRPAVCMWSVNQSSFHLRSCTFVHLHSAQQGHTQQKQNCKTAIRSRIDGIRIL